LEVESDVYTAYLTDALFLFYGVFMRLSAKGVQKHHLFLKSLFFFGKKSMSKTLYKKVEGGKKTFFLSFFSIRFVLIAFLAVFLHEEL
jgi:hypothetical protein